MGSTRIPRFNLSFDVHPSVDFSECIKWRLFAPDDFTTLHNQTLVVHKATNLTYGLGEFWPAGYASVYVCIPSELQPYLYPLDYMAVLVRGLSLLALLMSIAVDAWVVSDIQGKSVHPILCHKLSLIFFYACSCLCNSNYCGHGDLASDLMVSVCLYFIRVSYCWITVISRDMWHTFHPKAILRRPSTVSLAGSFALHRFACQAIYAFGLPAILVGTSLLMRLLPLPILRAWCNAGSLSGNIAQVIFMNTTISVIVLVNGVFCALIIHNLRRIRLVGHYEVLRLENRTEMYHVYLKLVVVSGLLYLVQLSDYVSGRYGKFSLLIVFPDWIASSQGLWLFLVYSCNHSVRKAFCTKVKHLVKRDK